MPEQPLHFLTKTGELLRYNLRKLGELTYHLARAGRTQDLLTHCLFNYHWLYAKVREREISDISYDLISAVCGSSCLSAG